MKDKLLKNSFLRFVLVGVCNTLLSLVLMFLLEGLGYWPSTAIAYVAGAALSFFLNRSFTFHSEEDFWRSLGKFIVNVAVCYVIAYALAQPLVSLVLGGTAIPPVWQERIAKVAGMGLYT
ncbi:MAG: GtrA family protein, partial [Oscillospiraceae bacterium]